MSQVHFIWRFDPFSFNLVCKDLQGQDTMLFK